MFNFWKSKDSLYDVMLSMEQRITNLEHERTKGFYGVFDESAHITGKFWTDGIAIKVNGEQVHGAFRFQLDCKKQSRMVVIDSYGKDPKVINNDRAYVYRIYLTLED